MAKTIICKDVYGNQYTVPVDELNIRVGVYAVIIEDNKILLTRQWDGYSLIERRCVHTKQFRLFQVRWTVL